MTATYVTPFRKRAAVYEKSPQNCTHHIRYLVGPEEGGTKPICGRCGADFPTELYPDVEFQVGDVPFA